MLDASGVDITGVSFWNAAWVDISGNDISGVVMTEDSVEVADAETQTDVSAEEGELPP